MIVHFFYLMPLIGVTVHEERSTRTSFQITKPSLARTHFTNISLFLCINAFQHIEGHIIVKKGTFPSLTPNSMTPCFALLYLLIGKAPTPDPCC